MITITEKHITLLNKEIKSLERNLFNAKKRKGVTPEEISNIEEKLQLKIDILLVLGGVT